MRPRDIKYLLYGPTPTNGQTRDASESCLIAKPVYLSLHQMALPGYFIIKIFGSQI